VLRSWSLLESRSVRDTKRRWQERNSKFETAGWYHPKSKVKLVISFTLEGFPTATPQFNSSKSGKNLTNFISIFRRSTFSSNFFIKKFQFSFQSFFIVAINFHLKHDAASKSLQPSFQLLIAQIVPTFFLDLSIFSACKKLSEMKKFSSLSLLSLPKWHGKEMEIKFDGFSLRSVFVENLQSRMFLGIPPLLSTIRIASNYLFWLSFNRNFCFSRTLITLLRLRISKQCQRWTLSMINCLQILRK
jgi:hypothetical protein